MVRLIFGREFAASAPEGMQEQGGGIELRCKYNLHAPKKYTHSIKKAIRQEQRSYYLTF